MSDSAIILAEFQDFKEKEEERMQCRFVLARGEQETASTVYNCHRSGQERSRATGKRLPKSQGSNKTGFSCPAIISVKNHNGLVKIDYQSNHYGHGSNIGRLNLTRKERLVLAGN